MRIGCDSISSYDDVKDTIGTKVDAISSRRRTSTRLELHTNSTSLTHKHAPSRTPSHSKIISWKCESSCNRRLISKRHCFIDGSRRI